MERQVLLQLPEFADTTCDAAAATANAGMHVRTRRLASQEGVSMRAREGVSVRARVGVTVVGKCGAAVMHGAAGARATGKRKK